MAIIESTITTMIFRMIIIKLLPSIEEEQPQHQRHKRTVTMPLLNQAIVVVA